MSASSPDELIDSAAPDDVGIAESVLTKRHQAKGRTKAGQISFGNHRTPDDPDRANPTGAVVAVEEVSIQLGQLTPVHHAPGDGASLFVGIFQDGKREATGAAAAESGAMAALEPGPAQVQTGIRRRDNRDLLTRTLSDVSDLHVGTVNPPTPRIAEADRPVA